jgi:redox-sensitive bicupin YhaK (pirin superfamily)
MQLKHVPASRLFVSEPDPSWFGNPPNEIPSQNWLESRFHFSFAEYSNRLNSNFGVLRVMNDDFVQPSRGFGTHGHANMEIITYIVQGKLTHKDSMGTEETLGRGSVQFMTAGRGVQHSEFNLEKDMGLRFIQTWIVPRRDGLLPQYGSFDPDHYGDKSRNRNICTARNQWRHLVSDTQDTSSDTPVRIEQDANLFVAEMDAEQSLEFLFKNDRMAYVLCVEGSVKLITDSGNTVILHRHDGCEVKPGGGRGDITLTFNTIGSEEVEGGDLSAHVLMFEVARVEGSGRRDL